VTVGIVLKKKLWGMHWGHHRRETRFERDFVDEIGIIAQGGGSRESWWDVLGKTCFRRSILEEPPALRSRKISSFIGKKGT